MADKGPALPALDAPTGLAWQDSWVGTPIGDAPPNRGGGFAVPSARPGEVDRTRLLAELRAESDRPVVSVVAPAGSGKSLFAAQWCRLDERPAVWVPIRTADNDPVLLLGRLAGALETLEEFDPGLVTELDHPAPRMVPLVARFAAGLSQRAPMVVVLDDVHLVERDPALDVIRAAVDAMPRGSQLVVVSRADPPVALARRRVAHDLVEVRAADLAFDESETAQFVADAGLDADSEEVSGLWRRTEGWATGVALATMAAARTPAARLDAVSGGHRHLAEYFSQEVLSRLSDDVRTFLIETSVLERLSGPLCDAVTGRRDSGRLLRDLEASSLFVVPLDYEREWYRYHHLFGDLLSAERSHRPEMAATSLLARAAAWHEERGDAGEAFDYARRGGDFDRAGRVLLQTWDSYAARGRVETLLLWLSRCSDQNIETDPQLSLGAALVALLVGDIERASRYLSAAQLHDLDRPSCEGATSLRAIMLTVRANLAPDGATQMLEDSLAVVASEGSQRTRWLVSGLRNAAVAHMALSSPREAADALLEALHLSASQPRLEHVHLANLGLLTLVLLDLGEVAEADRRMREAEERMVGVEQTLQAVPVATARACLAAATGDVGSATAALTQLHDGLPLLLAIPCLQAELALRGAIAARTVGETTSARALAGEARLAAARLGDSGTLCDRIAQATTAQTGIDPRLALLSPAEARVLRQLATHLTLQEIADRLFVSRATVKTQVATVYAKLGATSRAEAVAIAYPENSPSNSGGSEPFSDHAR